MAFSFSTVGKRHRTLSQEHTGCACALSGILAMQPVRRCRCSGAVMPKNLGQCRIILSADTACEVRQVLSQKRRQYFVYWRAFWQRRCRVAAAGAVLKPSGGNCAVLPQANYTGFLPFVQGWGDNGNFTGWGVGAAYMPPVAAIPVNQTNG